MGMNINRGYPTFVDTSGFESAQWSLFLRTVFVLHLGRLRTSASKLHSNQQIICQQCSLYTKPQSTGLFGKDYCLHSGSPSSPSQIHTHDQQENSSFHTLSIATIDLGTRRVNIRVPIATKYLRNFLLRHTREVKVASTNTIFDCYEQSYTSEVSDVTFMKNEDTQFLNVLHLGCGCRVLLPSTSDHPSSANTTNRCPERYHH